jgi:Cu/Ag efflux pump CusA
MGVVCALVARMDCQGRRTAKARAASSRSLMLGAASPSSALSDPPDRFWNHAPVTALVFLTLPFALVGAVAAAFLTGGVISLGSLVGLVTVIGIAARNGIISSAKIEHPVAVVILGGLVTSTLLNLFLLPSLYLALRAERHS